jgi:hypothetical protein
VVTGITLFTVPPGSKFVLTDLEWYGRFVPGDNEEVALILRADTDQRWLALEEFNLPGSAYQTLPIGGHWTTGLVFDGTDVGSVPSPVEKGNGVTSG